MRVIPLHTWKSGVTRSLRTEEEGIALICTPHHSPLAAVPGNLPKAGPPWTLLHLQLRALCKPEAPTSLPGTPDRCRLMNLLLLL